MNQAYVIQMGMWWYCKIRAPNGEWVCLAQNHLTAMCAVNYLEALGYTADRE